MICDYVISTHNLTPLFNLLIIESSITEFLISLLYHVYFRFQPYSKLKEHGFLYLVS